MPMILYVINYSMTSCHFFENCAPITIILTKISQKCNNNNIYILTYFEAEI